MTLDKTQDQPTTTITAPTVVTWWHFHRRLYNWVLHWAQTPYGARALFILSFAESSCFPVPPDVLLAPLALGNRKKWFSFALNCSIASVLGGIAGYCIGMFLWSAIGNWVFAHMAWAGMTTENFAKFKELYDKYDFWIVFTCGFTPLPYKVCTITSGIARINFPAFVIASALSRSARFFLVAGLFGFFGEKIKPFIDKYLDILSLIFVVVLIGSFVVIKYI